jgi:hypothetical protein
MQTAERDEEEGQGQACQVAGGAAGLAGRGKGGWVSEALEPLNI